MKEGPLKAENKYWSTSTALGGQALDNCGSGPPPDNMLFTHEARSVPSGASILFSNFDNPTLGGVVTNVLSGAPSAALLGR